MQFVETQGQPLGSYLQNQITIQEYFQIAEQMMEMLDKVQSQGMQIVLDLSAMQIQNGKVGFQVITEDSVYEIERVAAFLKEMTFAAVFAGNQNYEEITSFLRYLDGLGGSSRAADIRDYCREHMQPQSPVQSLNMRQPQSPVQSQNMRQPQSPVQPQSMRQPQSPVQPEDGETGVLGAGFWKELEAQCSRQAPESDETGVLDPSFWQKALQNTPSTRLDNKYSGNVVYGKLVHVKTGKETLITQENFWVGKEGVDLQINKDIISRRHAVIICKNNHFFVSDNGSTNKTYVDNREIPPRASVEIFNGTHIKFANEEYELQI